MAWRSLAKNKRYGTINIAGLAVGMAVSFLLLLYVHHEYSYDRFNVNSDRLYLTFKNQPGNGQIKTKSITPVPLAAALKKDLPEIEQVARTSNSPENSLISYRDKHIKMATIAADPALLDLFSFELVKGKLAGALAGPEAMVLTRSAATALFGNLDPVGQTVRINNEWPMTVRAVIKDNPANSSLSFTAMISWESLVSQRPWIRDMGWDNFSYSTYVLLKQGAFPATVNEKVRGLIGKYYPDGKDISLFLYPVTRLHLYNEFRNGFNTGGRIGYVRLFLVLAISILVIACINFMNLSTARSEKRAREVGVRKAIGARRWGLVQQFMTESVLLSFLAAALALAALFSILPAFNRLAGIQLSIPYDKAWAWMALLGISVLTGLVAGSYPALFLSSFKPVKVLKGVAVTAAAARKPRQVMVIVQFTIAICLIVSSIFIYKQINYIRDRPIGYDRYGLVEMPADGKLGTMFEAFRREAIEAGAISDGAMTSAAITSNQASVWGVTWPDQRPGEDKLAIDCMGATYHFISTYNLQLTQGRDFDPGRPGDSAAVILNDAALQLMRLQEPLGRQITWMGSKRTIIGVVDNFVWGSPYEPVKAAIIGFVPGWTGNIGLRLNPHQSISRSLSILQSVYQKYNPGYPFEYVFTDESYSKKYSDEQVLGSISLGFTSLAIFISCLGLFGLASFSAEQRRKELGIRKILGASAGSLWFKLSREFVQLILISFVFGSAISWYGIHQFLARYTFHTSFSFWIVLLTLPLSIVICLVAVSWQAIRAARANPVMSLRSE